VRTSLLSGIFKQFYKAVMKLVRIGTIQSEKACTPLREDIPALGHIPASLQSSDDTYTYAQTTLAWPQPHYSRVLTRYTFGNGTAPGHITAI
jgi:hypothetical protein